MLKRFAVVAVLALFATNAAYSGDAKSADKDFKTTTKTALGVLNTSVKSALSTFGEAVKTDLANIKSGTGLTTLHTTLEGQIKAAIQAIYTAVVTANNTVDGDGSDDLDSANAGTSDGPDTQFNFMEGDGGTLDKFNASVKKVVDKAMATIAKGAAKVVKAANKDGTVGLTARVNALRLPAAPSPSGSNLAAVTGTVVPFQITHLVGINTTPSAAGGCQVLAGGLSNGAVSFAFLEADLTTSAGTGSAVALSTNMFLATSSATLDAQNFEVEVGEDDTGITVGSEQDSIGAP